MAADSGMKNNQRSDTNCCGRKAVNAEDHTTFYGEEEPAYRRKTKIRTQRERERESKRHKEYGYIQEDAIVTK